MMKKQELQVTFLERENKLIVYMVIRLLYCYNYTPLVCCTQ